MTQYGGSTDSGVLFEWDPSSENFTLKLEFDGKNGAAPMGSLVEASNGNLYGMTYAGGKYDLGVLFAWDMKRDTLIILEDFQGKENGSHPSGSLLRSVDNNLYGLTGEGGVNNKGVIFEFNPFTGTFEKKADLDSTTRYPSGSLFQASDGRFYGMSPYGGSYEKGSIFEWLPSSGQVDLKFEFDGLNGSYPHGTLIQGDSGRLTGLTGMGGINNAGVLFEWDPKSGDFIKKHDFEPILRNYKNTSILGSLYKTSNGKLYGMTFNGGPAGTGTIFEWDPVNESCQVVFNFFSRGNGSCPTGTFLQAENGKFYGTCTSGGNYDEGVLYEWDPGRSMYTKKIDFDGPLNGKIPYGSLIMTGNKRIYGVTMAGGKYNSGVLFEYIPEINKLVKLHDFDQVSGIFPVGSLVLARNGKIYGTTSTGGLYSSGVIFEWNPDTEEFVKRYDFPYSYYASFQFTFTDAYNGKLYGIRDRMLFEWDPENGNLVKKFDFIGNCMAKLPSDLWSVQITGYSTA